MIENVSVIIPAFEDVAGVMRAINSLHQTATTSDFDIHVQDDSRKTIMAGVIPLSLASYDWNPEQLGFGGNCNKAAEQAQGEIFFFVNQDVYAMPTFSDAWDDILTAFFHDRGDCIVGIKLLSPDTTVQHAGVLLDGKGQPTHRGYGWQHHRHARLNCVEKMTAVTGAALATTRSVWTQLDGFDPIFEHSYFEDIDFCLRAAEAGYDTYYLPSIEMFHMAGSSGGNPLFIKNAIRFKERWIDSGRRQPDMTEVREAFWL